MARRGDWHNTPPKLHLVSDYHPLMHLRLLTARSVIIAIMLCVVAAASLAMAERSTRVQAVDDRLLSASSDEHLWLVRPALPNGLDGDQPRLLHHALAMDGPHFSRGPTLTRMPEAVAAHGDRAWVVFEPQEAGGELRRTVHTVRMQRDPAMGMYQPERLTLSEALPGWGKLAGFAAGEGGPMALLVPRSHETLSVWRDGRDASNQARSPQLWQLRNERWVQMQLPGNLLLRENDVVNMAFDGEDRARLNLLIVSDGDVLLAQRDQDETWKRTTLDESRGAARSLIAAGERAAVLAVDEGIVNLAYLRPPRVIELAEFAVPSGHWCVNGMRDGFRLIMQHRDGELAMQRIDGVTGRVGEMLTMTDQPLPAAKLWHTGLMLAVSVVAVLIVLLVRPGGKSMVQLPKHVVIVPAVPRLAALLIDLAPAAVLTVLITRTSPVELLRIPMLAETIDQAGPHLLMLGITFLHCTILELLMGTSLGKMLIGAGVAAADGTRPRISQVLVRNGVKLMVLIVPPLAVFALLNPYMQGFNDVAAGTIVLRDTEDSEGPIEEKR